MDDKDKIEHLRRTIAAAWDRHAFAIAGRALSAIDVAAEDQIHRLEMVLEAFEIQAETEK
jgi:H2-forming N5,N10-methylenetetrahydromethanopterin dehydrogenase-like enzyme